MCHLGWPLRLSFLKPVVVLLCMLVLLLVLLVLMLVMLVFYVTCM